MPGDRETAGFRKLEWEGPFYTSSWVSWCVYAPQVYEGGFFPVTSQRDDLNHSVVFGTGPGIQVTCEAQGSPDALRHSVKFQSFKQ